MRCGRQDPRMAGVGWALRTGRTWGGRSSCGRRPPRRARVQSTRSESRAAPPAGACSSMSPRGATPSAAAAREGPRRRATAVVARRLQCEGAKLQLHRDSRAHVAARPHARADAPEPEASDRRAPPPMGTHCASRWAARAPPAAPLHPCGTPRGGVALGPRASARAVPRRHLPARAPSPAPSARRPAAAQMKASATRPPPASAELAPLCPRGYAS